MPNDYLVHVLVLGTATAAALGPPRRPYVLARAGFLAGMVVNEVPHLVLLLLGLSTTAAVVSGELGADAVSVVLLGAAVGTAVMLLALLRRAALAGAVVDRALVVAGVGSRARRRSWWRVALWPFPFRPRSVERIRNLPYGPHRLQRVDVLRRRGHSSAGPVLVYFHGGGYFAGTKRWEAQGLLHHYAARGWVCVSANYRLRPKAGFEEHLADAHAAMGWARQHARDLGGDPTRLVMAGSSTGAHLTSLYALRAPVQDRPNLAVCLYGYYGRYYGRGEVEPVPSSPFALDATDAPPFLISHGTLDSHTPASAARALAEKLSAESSNPVVYAELPGGQHAFDLLRSWRLDAVISAVDALTQDLNLEATGHDSRHARRDAGQEPTWMC